MWMLENETDYLAERTWVRDRDGRHEWIVVVKATFEIAPDGTLSLSEEPVEPLHAPEFEGEDGLSSIRYEADLVGMKPATDVYLNAAAYAPSGKAVRAVDVGFRVGPLQKRLRVCGPRVWRRGLTGRVRPGSSEPFVSAPIRYEQASGGYDASHPNTKKHKIDPANPIGSGVARRKQTLIGSPAPTVVDPVRRRSSRPVAGGFGAVASHWSPRREYAGTYDEVWARTRKPLLPADFDPRFHLCAPSDQQVPGYLQGGEVFELSNLTPEGRLSFRVPTWRPRFETFIGNQRHEHGGKIVSIIVDTDRSPRLVVVWQTALACGNDADYLDRTVIRAVEGTG